MYDVIVVGGGHAGCEAAAAAGNLGCRTLLVSMHIDRLAYMSCNPAVGGIAKGQIVREIDALGGYMGLVTDAATLQFRMLNRSKGPAVWSPRAQCDMFEFSAQWRRMLESTRGVSFRQDTVTELIVENGRTAGVKTAAGQALRARAVILTAGTFLNGRIHIGEVSFSGGRIGEKASVGLSEQLDEYGFERAQLKTGTPVRIDGRTIDFRALTPQYGDGAVFEDVRNCGASVCDGGDSSGDSGNGGDSGDGNGVMPEKFSFLPPTERWLYNIKHQQPCYIAYTSEEVHNELRKGFEKSPMFQGRIQGTGPRYCPSIEDKIVRFADKERHQLFVEPVSRNSIEYYLNGFSSSLPEEVQIGALHKIKGMEKAEILRSGYAIEYDFFMPTGLRNTLETKNIANLYFAGQINGTTGYEEAAAQGLIAGANAALALKGAEPFILGRNEAYIGVLIDDLITKGVDEPYRMFTSRAEFRILLRQDNADERLTPKSFAISLARKERILTLEKKRNIMQKIVNEIEKTKFQPQEINDVLNSLKTAPILQVAPLKALLQRPQISIFDIVQYSTLFHAILDGLFLDSDSTFFYAQPTTEILNPVEVKNVSIADDVMVNIMFKHEILSAVEIAIKYQNYIEKEKENVARLLKNEALLLRKDLDYSQMKSLSSEAREKLAKIKPTTVGQAARISGVSPSDISMLLIYLQSHSSTSTAASIR
ncbi:MAG: tRNA uridine-5-carboxymethylaminomethyl(34) synthesis enzyme MnmG [Bacteroidales bacterium]|jgi:tRNA uridine 5-carboxymethylaminomethyl modification enzyme|nr:tRNA uridine-5-carboxymethylaminomethyl(34) synthesis enzyme MnmG [Bacteroidales bacterium]